MTIELFDDVAWEKDGQVQELLQLKHHQQSAGNLSDMSVDLWKTLKVWLDTPAFADAGGPLLTLLTTSECGTGTAAANLGPGSARDPGRALELLDDAARNSTSTTTEAARSAWLKTPSSVRVSMIERIRILGGEVRIEDVEAHVRNEISWALPIGQEQTFLSLFWQWWRKVALDLLQKRRERVDVLEAQQQVQAIRDMFVPDNLPTLVELSQINEETLVQSHEAHIFVHQLRWVNVSTPHLRKAIGDYYRAVTQTTEWIDRSLIGLNELSTFEDNLADEWERAYTDMMEDLDEDADEACRKYVGRELWRKLRDSTAVSVRNRYTDAFFARGKRHELADRYVIGWHPDFEDRVQALITERLTHG
ncbi:ABC-three component system protein [Arthrobacter silvisoli]|uniref:ABC-three component system protein n=1 Tax=Arthrobacter silvisoli TaxID=2291022 RepID=UPI00109BD7C9|nr:ABC-three component system protein [Arthrobacter silvisoli]